jgi:RHS repeat-associated protein
MGSKTLVQTTTSDGLGRAIKQETKDAAGQNSSIVDTQYDSLGRVSQVSNPHAPGVTPGQSVTQYDAIGRTLKIIPPDGSATSNNTQFLYLGNAVTVTDPAGKQRRSFTNSLGQLVQVDEPGWGDATPGTGSVTFNGSLARICTAPGPPPNNICQEYLYDHGTVQVTVGTFTATVSYAYVRSNNTAAAVASALAAQLNGTSSPITATVVGTTINLTARQTGKASNYSLSASSTSADPNDFPQGSFSPAVSGPALTGGTDTATQDAPSLDHPMPTLYTYDGLGNLTLTVQGVQQRQFIYDSLGQLTSATTPEAGTVSYTYGSFTGLVASRTDARNVVTNYSYDGLNRLYQISYNVGTSGVPATATTTLTYGTNASQNNKGRLITMADGVGSENYSYDALGRATQLSKTINGVGYPLNYAYDIVGNVKQITYPSGRIVQQTTDSLGRLAQVSSSGTNYVTGISYNSSWEPTGFNYGNGVQATFGYNARMQLASLGYTRSGATLLGLAYSYVAPNGGNNGQIASITDSVDSTRSTTFTYDAWSRLKQASNSQWTVTETYDRFGNRSAQSPPVMNSVLVDPNTNRLLSSYAYDAAGNMTNDGSNTLVYDAENRAVSAANGGNSGTYTYDGKGLRVKKVSGGTTTVYVFAGSKVIAEYQNGAAVASPAREYIYMGGQVAATLSGGTTTYHHPDELSTRVSTDSSGNTVRTFGHFPFGETWYETGTASKLKFTSYERDSESGNDFAMARFHVNRLGRFSTPDPLAGSLLDPQSLNRYSYVLNDPLNLFDPSGLQCKTMDDGSVADDGLPPPCDSPGIFDPQTVNVNGGGGGSGGDPLISPLRLLRNDSVGGTKQSILKCASITANGLSLAGLANVDESKHPALAAITNAFAGNTFSGIVDAGSHIASLVSSDPNTPAGGQAFAKANAQIAGDLALGGFGQGFPGAGRLGPGGNGIAGVATDWALNAMTKATPMLSIAGAATSDVAAEGLAGPIGLAKIGVDGLIFFGSFVSCTVHR